MRVSPLVVAFLAVAALSACGSPTAEKSCGPSSCGGCCDAAGMCQPGVSELACGATGVACVACSSGLVCKAGACAASATGGGTGGETGGGTGGATGGGTGGAVGGGTGGATGGGTGGATGGGTGGATGGGTGGAVGGGTGGATGGGTGGATGGGTGGATGGGTGGSVLGGTCAFPMSITFVNDTFSTSGFIAGSSGTNTSCQSGSTTQATGPEVVFTAQMVSPGYLFAAETGNATLAPVLKLHDVGCSSSPTACDGTTVTNRLVGFVTPALTAGSYALVADSSGGGGAYELVVSRATLIGDVCADARPIVLTGTQSKFAGDTRAFNATMGSSCDSSTSTTTDALFQFTPPRSGQLTLTATPGSFFDVNLSVRSGASCLASNEVSGGCSDTAGPGSPDTLTVPVTSGTTYWIRVGGYDSTDEGPFVLQLDLP